MNEKILIVGGGGFIGKHLANYLSSYKFEISILGRIYEKDFLNTNYSIYHDDLSNIDSYFDILNNNDVIIWLAHSLVPGIKLTSLSTDFEKNILPIIKTYENIASKSKLKIFIYISSGGAIYGESNKHYPISEDHCTLPISQYGLSKKMVEGYLNFLSVGQCFSTIILRPSNIYGPNQALTKPQGIVGFAIDAIKNDTVLTQYNMGLQVRDFLHIDDFCNGILKVLEIFDNNILPSETYNLGSGIGYSIKNVLDIIENLFNKSIQKKEMLARSFDCSYNVLDSEKFKKKFNWNPKISLEEGIRSIAKLNK